MLMNRLRTMLAGAHTPALAADEDAEADGDADAVGFGWLAVPAFVDVAVTVGLAVGLGEVVAAVGYAFGVLLGLNHAGP